MKNVSYKKNKSDLAYQWRNCHRRACECIVSLKNDTYTQEYLCTYMHSWVGALVKYNAHAPCLTCCSLSESTVFPHSFVKVFNHDAVLTQTLRTYVSSNPSSKKTEQLHSRMKLNHVGFYWCLLRYDLCCYVRKRASSPKFCSVHTWVPARTCIVPNDEQDK